MSQDINQLLQQGIAAAREGNNDEARKAFEQVLEVEEENVTAWLWMSRVVDDDNEKRICLTTVLQLDPGNAHAQKALEKLDSKGAEGAVAGEVMPGITRRMLQLSIGGLVGLAIFMCIIVFGVTSSNNARKAEETRVANQAIANQTGTVAAQIAFATQTADVIIQTQNAIISPTPTPTNTPIGPTLPPTFTPTPSPTEEARIPPLESPQNIPGNIIGWGGRPARDNFYEIRLFPVIGGGSFTPVTDDAREADLNPANGQRVIFTASTTGGRTSIDAITVTGAQPETISGRFGITSGFFDPGMARWSRDGNQIIFAAMAGDNQTSEIWLVNMVSNTLARLTTDPEANYTWPALSPDGSRFVAVRTTQAGSDLVVIQVGQQGGTPVTSDLSTITEMSPVWSPDGALIAYAAAPANDPENHDIYVRLADGTGTATLLNPPEVSGSDNLYPVYNPDGRYMAFASNRTGSYDIYVYEFATQRLTQLTDSLEEYNFPGGWAN